MLPASSLILMFMLGLRHGFDPDHIAMIDSMAYRSLEQRPRLAPWMGTLFALGHGLTVTAIAVALGALAGEFALPAALQTVLDWLPAALLLLVGTLNLRSLLRRDDYQPQGFKTRLLPARLRNSSHPLAVVMVGVLFALVFDTATQAAAWGYAASTGSGATTALLAGLVFTCGMVLTDTLDGRLMVRLMRHAAGRDKTRLYRRRIGWAVVLISYGTALYMVVTHFRPELELGETAFTMVGAALVCGLLFGCISLALTRPAASLPLAQE
jgi:high-affinity nickel-transport protein